MNQQYQTVRTIDKYMITNFVIHLSYKMWGTVFLSNNNDSKFSSFLNTHLGIIYLSFPYKLIKIGTN